MAKIATVYATLNQAVCLTDLEALIYNDRSLWGRHRLKTYRKSAFLISYQVSNGQVDRLTQ